MATEKSTTAHTPLPWIVDEQGVGDRFGYILARDSDGLAGSVVRFERPYGQADAEHIVRCVSSHDDLVAVLREIVGQERPNPFGFDAGSVALDDGWRSRARAALAKAQS